MIAIASFKLRFRDRHVRIVPATDESGCVFGGPGVDVLGADAERIFAEAEPMLEWLRARQPGVVVRSLSVDQRTGRVLVSFEDAHDVARGKPMVLRVDPPASDELLRAASPLLPRLEAHVRAALENRSRR